MNPRNLEDGFRMIRVGLPTLYLKDMRIVMLDSKVFSFEEWMKV